MESVKKLLTIDEAKRGIYIDFEGFKGKSYSSLPKPLMLGAWSVKFKKFEFSARHGLVTPVIELKTGLAIGG